MTVLTLQPSAATGKDTYIDAGNPTFNYGVSTALAMTGASPVRRTFIQFDLSSIPANSTIVSAILTLTNTAFSGSPNITVNRITTAWFEGAQNGAAPSAGQDGSTYNLRNANGSVAYTAGAGGDIGATIVTLPFSSFVQGGANDINLTTEVQGIYAGTIANNGWALITSGGGFAFTFASSDHATAGSRPKLTITYSSGISGAIAGTSTATAVGSSNATIATLQPGPATSKDTRIVAFSNQNFNNGLSTTLNTSAGPSTARTLIQFDLSSIPVGAVINSAILTLVLTGANSLSSTVTVEVHRALTDWFEGNGNDSLSTIAGSSWTKRDQFNSLDWGGNTAGGQSGTDYSATVAASTSVTGLGSYTWNLTSEVDAMVSGATTNRGWWLIQTSGADKTFVSSDNSGASSSWPKLVVEYTLADRIIGVVAGTSTATGTLNSGNRILLNLQPAGGSGSSGIDVTLRSANATRNYGLSAVIGAGTFGGGEEVGLLKFNISALPPGVSIISASLFLYAVSEDSSTDRNVAVYRSFVQWYEGIQNNANPGIGEDASTWIYRNANGSISWTGAFGGAAGTEYESVATDTKLITTLATTYIWNVTADVAFWQAGGPNYGWWIRGTADSLSRKNFYSSDSASGFEPKLVIVYELQTLQGTVNGTSTATAIVLGAGNLHGSIDGTSDVTAQIITNFFSTGHLNATSTASGILHASGHLAGNSFGDSTAIGHIRAEYQSVGNAAGTSAHVAHLKGRFNLVGATSGSGFATAHIYVRGQIQGLAVGSSTAVANGYARATNVAAVIGCNPVPLFFITNGSTKPNGQLNILNFLGDRAGYFLVNYKPQIAQYKDQGYWSSSPQSQGRRLRGKVFENSIDTIEVSARAGSQDALIQYQQDLLDFQEAASDYWASEYAFLPYYLVARAARETNTRYAVIHMISCPELENPYTQPFFDDAVGATFVSLTIHIEHGLWTSTPPGRFDCVEVSGQREWTVSGWQVGT